MPDLLAGTEILAQDFPPAVWAQDTTAINNPTNTTYAPGTPEVGTTFTAPTTGRVLLVVGGGLGNSASSDRIYLSPEVFLGTSSAGTQVLPPVLLSRGFSSEYAAAAFHYGSRESILEGLTPGAVYYARIVFKVNPDPGTQTGDIACRDITVVPIP
jgi:hypothetical protein